MRSDFIDLAAAAGDGRPRVIERLTWAADLPPRTKVQLRSRSGNTLQEVFSFFDKKGDEVTEERYNSLPGVLQGPVDTSVVVGEDWGAWSNFYQASGEAFQSQSPRRFVQLEMILSTDDWQVAPEVDALAIEFTDALVQVAKGRILPRQARLNEQTRFTYTLWPQGDGQDSGFDRLRFKIPGVVDGQVVLRVAGEQVEPVAVEKKGDSLLVLLPDVVLLDSVEVDFSARLIDYAALFVLDLGLAQKPGLWQSVEASERRGNLVLLPGLPDQKVLVGDLRVEPAAFTPNGDQINDQVEIGFILLKAQNVQPRVGIYDVAGRLVVWPKGEQFDGGWHFNWSGLDVDGAIVSPGVYLCRVDPGTASSGSVLRTVAVAY